MPPTHLAAPLVGVWLEGSDEPNHQAREGQRREERQQPLAAPGRGDRSIHRCIKIVCAWAVPSGGADRTHQAAPLEGASWAVASAAMVGAGD